MPKTWTAVLFGPSPAGGYLKIPTTVESGKIQNAVQKANEFFKNQGYKEEDGFFLGEVTWLSD